MVNISSITPEMYQGVLDDLFTIDKHAESTIAGAHSVANLIFKYAIKNKLILDNPSVGVIMPKKSLTVEEIENDTIEDGYLERDELEEFLTATKKHGLDQDLERFYLMAFSGMRSGELCALKWSDINFETCEIRITKTLFNPNNNMRKYELTPPKSRASIRTFDVDENIIDLLKSHKKNQAKIKLRNRKSIEDYNEEYFVFCRVNGYPFAQRDILLRMTKILRKTSISKKATPHIFRHTHISMLTEAGVDLNTIMERVGHEDPKTTLKVYTHITKKMKEDASEKVSIKFGDILNLAKTQEL